MTVYRHSSENMGEIKDSSVHLIITSPPYPMIAKWDKLFGFDGNNLDITFERQHEYLCKTWEECYRILIEGGIACINIGDATRSVKGEFHCWPNYSELVSNCSWIGFIPLIPILWKKISNRPNAFLGSGFLPPNAYIAQDCEYIAIFRKGKLRKFPPKDENRLASSFTKEERDRWFQQIWEIKGARGAGKTSAFPEQIPHRLIRMFSVFGDTVVDPFSGTGTTGEVAIKLNRKFIGYEID